MDSAAPSSPALTPSALSHSAARIRQCFRRWISELPLRRKLALVAVTPALLIALVVILPIIARDLLAPKIAAATESARLFQVISEEATAALERDDPAAAGALLERLRLRPEIAYASIYRSDGTVLAFHLRDMPEPEPGVLPREAPLPQLLLASGEEGVRFDGSRRVEVRELHGDTAAGMLRIDSEVAAGGGRSVAAVLILLILAGAAGVFAALRLESFVSGPILRLASAADRAASKHEFTERVPVESSDEIGDLTVDFNEILQQIEERDSALSSARVQIEARLDQIQKESDERRSIQEALRISEDTLRRMAFFDQLTGLPNRSLFNDRLGLAITQAQRDGSSLAVMFIDVDRFKLINDSLGHSVGDQLLKEMADRIRQTIRKGDTLARLSGDEFTVLLPQMEAGEDAGKVAEKILNALRAPFELAGQQWFVTASIGVSLFPADGTDPGSLIKAADTAMYRAKECGRDAYELYAPDLHNRAVERVRTETELRTAIARNELVLHYQPIVDLGEGAIVGGEALLRWQHPRRGLLSPATFISVAEETGLIVPIGLWVLRRACEDAISWGRPGEPPVRLAVNLSARQFQNAELVPEVRRILEETGFPPSRLDLEITETSAMEHSEQTATTLARLKQLGVRLSIDDFGTGYSSLSSLRNFPLDTLKIDRSFVANLPTDSRSAAVVEAIIALARGLGFDTVAEGVESEDQRDALREQGCGAFQGFLFSRPEPHERFLKLLAGE